MFKVRTTSDGGLQGGHVQQKQQQLPCNVFQVSPRRGGPPLSRHHHARPAGPGQPCAADPSGSSHLHGSGQLMHLVERSMTSHRNNLAMSVTT